MRKLGYYFIVSALLAGSSCRKEVETIVVQEVEKVYSWMPVSRIYGTEQVILNMTKDATSLYLQTPGTLGILTPGKPAAGGSPGYYVGALAHLPTDVRARIPMAADFLASAGRYDTLVQLIRPTEPVTAGYYGYINLRQLDRQAVGIKLTDSPRLPFGAVNRNNYLLFGYDALPYGSLRLVLAKVSLQSTGRLQAQPRTISLPVPPGTTYAYIRWIVAIDDYFLVNCDNNGLYKIREDGTVKRVFEPSITDACYKWQGTVYAVEEYNKVLVSKDDGETWQRYTGTPDAFTFSTYHVVSDSLIGISSGNIFTLKWKGADYTIRALKNDGFGQRTITSLEQLGDTVYVGTTGGLFKRPLNKFFESKLK